MVWQRCGGKLHGSGHELRSAKRPEAYVDTHQGIEIHSMQMGPTFHMLTFPLVVY